MTDDRSAADQPTRVWLVTDPTPYSTMADCVAEVDAYQLACIVTGAGGPGVVRSEHWELFISEDAAQREYRRRSATLRKE